MDTYDPTPALYGVAVQCATEAAALARQSRRRHADDHEPAARLVARSLRGFRAYEAERERLETAWAAAPSAYDQEQHATLQDTYDEWFRGFRTLVEALTALERDGCALARADEARDAYRTMVSIEWMDHGPMPEHVRQATEDAIAEAEDPDRLAS